MGCDMDRDFVPYDGRGDLLDGFLMALVWVRGVRHPWVYQVRNTLEARDRFERSACQEIRRVFCTDGDIPSVDYTQHLTTAQPTDEQAVAKAAKTQANEGPRGGGCIVHDMGYEWHCKRCGVSVRWCEEKGEPYTQAGRIKNGGLAGLPMTEHVFDRQAVPRKAFVATPGPALATPPDEPVPPHDIVPHVGIDWARIDPATKSEVEEPISEPGHLWLPGQL